MNRFKSPSLLALALTALLLTAAPTMVHAARTTTSCPLSAVPLAGSTWTTTCDLRGFNPHRGSQHHIPLGSRVYVQSTGVSQGWVRLQVLHLGHSLIVYP